MMKTFEFKLNTGKQNKSPASEALAQECFPRNSVMAPIRYLQRTMGNQAIQRLLQADSEEISTEIHRPMLTYGSQGPDVIYLQRRLNLYGANLVEDGIFGPLTNQAVKQFQAGHAPPADGIVGPITWGELEKNPAAPEVEPVPPGQTTTSNLPPGGAGTSNLVPGIVGQVVLPPMPLAAMPVGPFANFVNTNFIDRSVAALFNDLLVSYPNSPFANDAANFALQELGNGNLVGILLDTQLALLRPRLPAAQQNDINTIQANGLQNPGEYHQFFSQGIIRGFIVMDDAQIAAAQLPGATRDLTQLMVAHELNHHRNRYNAQTQVNQPVTQGEYVDVPLAFQHRQPDPTTTVREQFIQELTARHIAYRIEQERLTAQGQPTQPLQSGQFFNAAIDFARNDPGAYRDNGYMGTLAGRNPDDGFRRQVAIWMLNLRNMQFHSDPVQNQQIQLLIQVEFTMAEGRNFTQTANGPDGMR